MNDSQQTIGIENDFVVSNFSRSSKGTYLTKLIADVLGSIKHWQIWYTLGLQDIHLRYRRSALGPFWITISMAFTIYTMGFLYGHLFRSKIAIYFPHLATGVICWNLIATLLTESTEIFIESSSYIKNIKIPFLCYIFRLILRNMIVFAHNIVVLIPIFFIFDLHITWATLLFIPGLVIICLNAILYGTVIAVIGSRFRDLNQIVTSLIQVIFFLTPIIWMPSLLPDKYQIFVTINPFTHFLALLRNPILGNPYTMTNMLVVALITLVGFGLFTWVFGRYRSRIAFWI